MIRGHHNLLFSNIFILKIKSSLLLVIPKSKHNLTASQINKRKHYPKIKNKKKILVKSIMSTERVAVS